MKVLIITLILILNCNNLFSQPADKNYHQGTNTPSYGRPGNLKSPQLSRPNTNVPYRTPSPEEPSKPAVTTNTAYSSTNKTDVPESKSTSMANLGFFFLLKNNNEFKEKFSKGTHGDNQHYYRLPFNSWNDSFYVTLSYDWELGFLESIDPRWGWGIGFNFAGSGNGDPSIKVDSDTDLGKAKGDEFYAIYNNYKFPITLNLRIQPFSISIFKFYMGGGAGLCLNIATYNEIATKERSTYDEQFEKTFLPIKFISKIFFGISFETIEELQEIFLEVNYKFTENPIITNDYFETYDKEGVKTGGYKRSVSFQVSGLSLGFGFRF